MADPPVNRLKRPAFQDYCARSTIANIADLESELRPLAESLLGPEEDLRGACVATQQTTFRGWMVAIVVTDDVLILQKLTRKWEPDVEPQRLTIDMITEAKVSGAGGLSASVAGLLMDEVGTMLILKTTDGEKRKLRMMNADGGGLMSKLGGGEIQRQGVIALGEWFDRQV